MNRSQSSSSATPGAFESALNQEALLAQPDPGHGMILDAVERRARDANLQLDSSNIHSVGNLLSDPTSEARPLQSGFTEHVWIATAILRQIGRGPALVFTTPTDAPGFSHRIRPVLEKMGLRLGFDVIVYGLLEPTLDDFEFGIASSEDEPLFDGDESDELAVPSEAQVDEVWNAVNKVRPGFVAILRDPNNDPAVPDDVESWLNALPAGVPAIQGTEDWTRRSAAASRPSHETQVQPAAIIRRPTESHEIAAQLQRWTAQIVSITGRSGTGRSALISEVAARLQRSEQPMLLRHLRVPGETAIKSLEMRLRRVVANEAGIPEVIVIDDFDQIAQLETGFQAEKEFVDHIEQVCATGTVRFLIVLRDDHLDALAQANYELAERIDHVRVSELPRADLEDIVRQQTDLRLSAAGLELTDDLLDHALSPSTMPTRLGQPSLAINRIESALARARLRHSRVLTKDDFVVGPMQTSATSSSIMRTDLRERVRGQEEAIDTIVDAVTPAMLGLKLRPDRPHAVLLFAGPSGVGKTEAAKQLAKAAYGSEQAVVRLDMSEYANEEDARMKLIGASRIWKGSSTAGLLTSKIIDRPRCVVLLDEFEKAHPNVWNLFLQVFDEGRLTDGWGQVATFADTIIVMTSNLGAREGSERAAGFGAADGFNVSRQDAAITQALPPELQNRMTATVHFAPLSADAIREVAFIELERAFDQFARQGWQIEFDPAVVEWVARAGYDARFGARHVQRVIENEVFPLLAAADDRRVRLCADNSGLLNQFRPGSVASDGSPTPSAPPLGP